MHGVHPLVVHQGLPESCGKQQPAVVTCWDHLAIGHSHLTWNFLVPQTRLSIVSQSGELAVMSILRLYAFNSLLVFLSQNMMLPPWIWRGIHRVMLPLSDTIPTRNGRELGEIWVSKVGTNF